MVDKPIGVFDSGIGGLTVLKELLRQLPNETFLYVGDTARVPYGSKSANTVVNFSLQISTWLFYQNVKAIVVACNTASAHSLPYLRQSLSIPVFGVIQPGAWEAASKTKGRIGILATRGTIRSGAYETSLRRILPNVQVYSQSAPLLVPLIEEGELEGELIELVLKKYITPLRRESCDTLLLGCTHYPLIKHSIQNLWPEVQIIDSAEATASVVKQELKVLNLENEKTTLLESSKRYKIYLTDLFETFLQNARLFLQSDLQHYEYISIETLENSLSLFTQNVKNL